VTIWESEWYLKKTIVKAYLKSILGYVDNRVGARECSLVDLDNKTANEFMDKHHIQGRGAKGYSYGMQYQGVTVAAMCVKHMSNDPESMCIDRYAIASGWAIHGGFLKMLRHVRVLHRNIKKFITFSDNRWSWGNLYKNNGFQHTGDVRPSYWYFKAGAKSPMIHKSNFRKERIPGILPEETEWQAMQRLGYDRIWDCGKKKWVLVLDTPATP
jgi:hypothetical protein